MNKTKLNKLIKQLLVSTLAVVFVFAPLHFDALVVTTIHAEFDEDGYENIYEDTTWFKGEHVIEKGVFIDEGATLTIEEGAKIVFKKTSDTNPFFDVGNGRVLAIGSKDEKITFTYADEASKNYSIYIGGAGTIDSKTSFFRFVDFIG
ncbi:MAG: hypothetical protein ACD_9C00177G0005, partial [uncultured bacterium]